jgi:hypothetical protein
MLLHLDTRTNRGAMDSNLQMKKMEKEIPPRLNTVFGITL